MIINSKKGIRDDIVVKALASHQCGLGSIPGVDTTCEMSLLLALMFLLRRFFSGFSGFSPSTIFLNQHFQIPI